ncbi:MAG: four helix bundle protein [Candidatus Omnitrophota bacterium]
MNVPQYRKLIVWQKAHKNALLIINLLNNCSQKYSKIIDQCLGAATSIGANIAEGNSASSIRHKESYFTIALNSSYEFDNWLQIFKDAKIISNSEPLLGIEKENIEVIKILSKIVLTLKTDL